MKCKLIEFGNGMIYTCEYEAETATESVNPYNEMIFKLSEKNDKLKSQNKEMLEALIENLKESINLEVNRGILLKTAMIHNSHEIDIIEKHTGKTIDEVLK